MVLNRWFQKIVLLCRLSPFKSQVEFIDCNGMFSEFTMSTYTKILDTPYSDPEFGKLNGQ